MTTTFVKYSPPDGIPGHARERASVLVADREMIFRTGLRTLLTGQCGFDVVGEAESETDVDRLIRSASPDILLMEMDLARSVGLSPDRLGVLMDRPPRLVLFGERPGPDGMAEALEAGAQGFVTRTLDAELLEAVLRHVLVGGYAIGDDVLLGLVGKDGPRPVPRFAAHHGRIRLLNPSERQVLQLLGRGWENARIAAELHLSRASVKTYVSRLLHKLHLENRTQAALVANETGLADLAVARS
ncbi:response regulator transcription factor [Streptomyces sp. NPDC002054]|uniref:response regulator transcription factor n=1 Tax=Streptomyces sp. NPDC002054 TaxID=3154663 RepID=UPI00331CFE1A